MNFLKFTAKAQRSQRGLFFSIAFERKAIEKQSAYSKKY